MGIFDRTPEQIEAQKQQMAERKAQYAAEVAAREAERKAQYAARQADVERNRKLAAELDAAKATKATASSIIVGKRTLEIGKAYRLNGSTFTVQNPDNLTDKQKRAVDGMLRDFGLLTVVGMVIDRKVEDFYPFIDVLFQFHRREMTEATFRNILAIKESLETHNRFSDHDL